MVPSPSRGLCEIPKLHYAGGSDRFAQEHEQTAVDSLLRSGPGGEPLSVDQRLEIQRDSCQ